MASESQVIRARLYLLSELRSGSRCPGAPISVKQTAEALKLSHTPVREALARLAGEGVVMSVGDRNGFAVPRLGMRGFVDHVEMLELLIDRVLHQGPGARTPPPPMAYEGAGPLAAIESTISWIVGDHDNAQVARAIGLTGLILAAYRRVEPSIVPNWLSELRHVRAEIAAGRWEGTMRSYWQTRIALAGQIVDAVEHAGAGSNIFGI